MKKNGRVFTSCSFGYDTNLISVEVDIKRGMPATDIVGLSDKVVKENRERTIVAIKSSGEEYPSEHVLISLTPSDLKKDIPLDLPIALAVLNQQYIKNQNEPLLKEDAIAIGELELNGTIRPVRAAYSAALLAKESGINNFICNEDNYNEIKDINGLNFYVANNLSSLKDVLINNKKKKEITLNSKDNEKNILFNEDGKELWNENFPEKTTKKLKNIRQMAVAIAGKHNIEFIGAPGSGKTIIPQTMLEVFTPKLTDDEAITVKKIQSLAGLSKYPREEKESLEAPIRMPHQTASIEGMFGGGPSCRPGEVSLAHNGVLYLDDVPEFKNSVLQMLRIPVETQQITISRAGRTTTFPANFQLAISANPCPCGYLGDHNRMCLCSAKSIEMYNKKFSDPLSDRIEIKGFVKEEEEQMMPSYEEIKDWIKNAYEIQRNEGKYNNNLNSKEILNTIQKAPKEVKDYLDTMTNKNEFSIRQNNSAIKVAKTIANMEGRTELNLNDIKESISYIQDFYYFYDRNIEELKEQKTFLEKSAKQFTQSVVAISEGQKIKDEVDKLVSTEVDKLVILDKKLTDGLTKEQIKTVSENAVKHAINSNTNSISIEHINKEKKR